MRVLRSSIGSREEFACAHLHPQRSLAVLRNKEQKLRLGTGWYSDPTPRIRATNP
jgi:hypothetical protein